MENNLITTIVYLTVNLKNNKIYVGVHDIDEKYPKFDGYLGNGVNINKPSSILHPKEPFQYAVKKYGFNSFRRYTLFECTSRKEALDWEKIIVNEEFLQRTDVYNISLGGGDPPVYKRQIYRYSLTGEFIKEYKSVQQASKDLNIEASAISHAANFKSISGNSYWTDYFIEKIDVKNFSTQKQSKEIYTYDSNGKFLRQYNSIMDFVREEHTNLGVVQRAIKTQTKIHNKYISFEKLDSFKKKITQKHYRDPIHQYSLTGEYIKTFNSISEVVKKLGKVYQDISHSIQLQTTCGGFQWSWEKLDKMPNKEKNVYKSRKVGQYTLDGQLVKKWNTVRECRKEFGNVSKVLNGRASQTKGFTFKYID